MQSQEKCHKSPKKGSVYKPALFILPAKWPYGSFGCQQNCWSSSGWLKLKTAFRFLIVASRFRCPCSSFTSHSVEKDCNLSLVLPLLKKHKSWSINGVKLLCVIPSCELGSMSPRSCWFATLGQGTEWGPNRSDRSHPLSSGVSSIFFLICVWIIFSELLASGKKEVGKLPTLARCSEQLENGLGRRPGPWWDSSLWKQFP